MIGNVVPIRRPHQITACLRRWGWQRDDAPFDDVGECTDVTGCYRAGRWTHPYRQGMYCAQHAHMGGPEGFGGHG